MVRRGAAAPLATTKSCHEILPLRSMGCRWLPSPTGASSSHRCLPLPDGAPKQPLLLPVTASRHFLGCPNSLRYTRQLLASIAASQHHRWPWVWCSPNCGPRTATKVFTSTADKSLVRITLWDPANPQSFPATLNVDPMCKTFIIQIREENSRSVTFFLLN